MSDNTEWIRKELSAHMQPPEPQPKTAEDYESDAKAGFWGVFGAVGSSLLATVLAKLLYDWFTNGA